MSAQFIDLYWPYITGESNVSLHFAYDTHCIHMLIINDDASVAAFQLHEASLLRNLNRFAVQRLKCTKVKAKAVLHTVS